MSLYADYIRERTTDEIIEIDEGFATYRYVSVDTVYIVDIYVIPAARQYGHGKAMADVIAKIAKEKGCQYMIGTVSMSAKGSSTSLKALLGYGLEPYQVNGDAIIMRKEI